MIAAIDHQLAELDKKLESNALSEDEHADLGNDRGYLRALRTTFEDALKRP